jgi:glycerol-3-phosphate acyltransferase PlsY
MILASDIGSGIAEVFGVIAIVVIGVPLAIVTVLFLVWLLKKIVP